LRRTYGILFASFLGSGSQNRAGDAWGAKPRFGDTKPLNGATTDYYNVKTSSSSFTKYEKNNYIYYKAKVT